VRLQQLKPRTSSNLRERVFRLTLGKKLSAGFACLVAIVLAVVGVSSIVASQLASSTNNITHAAEADLIGGYTVAVDASNLANAQARYVLDGGKSLAAYTAADSALGVALEHLSALANGNARRVALDAAVQSAYMAFDGNDQTIFSFVQGHKMSRAVSFAGSAHSTVLVSDLEAAAHAYIANARALRAADLRSFSSTKATGQTIEIVLAAIAVALASLIGAFITFGIKRDVKPVLDQLENLNEHCASDIRDALERLAEGDLTLELEPSTDPIERVGRDELGQITAAVNGIRERLLASVDAYNKTRVGLQGMIGSVAETATTVVSSSDEMAFTSEEGGKSNGEIARAVNEIAEGAERQAKMIDDAKSSVEDVVLAATSASGDARATVEAAVATRGVARAGVGAAQQASEVMASVRESSLAVNNAIAGLAAKSDQIGKIVETISGIAKQTNLLALNAAIEAARAGDQGRSFAVVAEQVRALAEESQVAAHEIGELIGAIQHETASAVGVVAEGARRTEDGTLVVEQTREAFVNIGESIEDMTTRIEAIAAGSEQIAKSATAMHETISEVASVAEQSSAATEQVSAATQQTSATAQAIASRAHVLSTKADELNKLVRRFKLAYSPLG
jgi:methyl-accepting chemotaxis protein